MPPGRGRGHKGPKGPKKGHGKYGLGIKSSVPLAQRPGRRVGQYRKAGLTPPPPPGKAKAAGAPGPFVAPAASTPPLGGTAPLGTTPRQTPTHPLGGPPGQAKKFARGLARRRRRGRSRLV